MLLGNETSCSVSLNQIELSFERKSWGGQVSEPTDFYH